MLTEEEKQWIEKVFARYHKEKVSEPGAQIAFDIGRLIGLVSRLNDELKERVEV